MTNFISSTNGAFLDKFDWQCNIIHKIFLGATITLFVPPKLEISNPQGYCVQQVSEEIQNICERLSEKFGYWPATFYWFFYCEYSSQEAFYFDCGDVFFNDKGNISNFQDQGRMYSVFKSLGGPYGGVFRIIPSNKPLDYNDRLNSLFSYGGNTKIPRDKDNESKGFVMADELALSLLPELFNYNQRSSPKHNHKKWDLLEIQQYYSSLD